VFIELGNTKEFSQNFLAKIEIPISTWQLLLYVITGLGIDIFFASNPSSKLNSTLVTSLIAALFANALQTLTGIVIGRGLKSKQGNLIDFCKQQATSDIEKPESDTHTIRERQVRL
jgi:ABC-type dipeptide/oligopeptide/nickel transport system permease component